MLDNKENLLNICNAQISALIGYVSCGLSNLLLSDKKNVERQFNFILLTLSKIEYILANINDNTIDFNDYLLENKKIIEKSFI